MPIDTTKLAKDMVVAASGVFNDTWPSVKDYAESELKDFAENLVDISARLAAGRLSEDNAKAMVRAQVKSVEIVLLAVQGIGILMAESAVNAALDVARTTINTSIGFALI